MKPDRPSRQPILERRRLKQGARDAEAVRQKQREHEKAKRELGRIHALVNPANLAPDNSYGTPDFVRRGYYLDKPFTCKSCGKSQVWTETQQKWWYETAKGSVWAVAVLCRPCRRQEQARRTTAREVHLAGLATKGAKNAA